MKRTTEYQFTEGQFDEPAAPELLDAVRLTVDVPDDYIDFLRRHNGGAGFVGDSYIVLWKGEELAEFNRNYEVEKYAPGIFLFGSDGGGEGYGFDLLTPGKPIVRVPFIGMERRYAIPVAKDLPGLFVHLFQMS